MEDKLYTCECGLTFNNRFRCSSHKQSCEAHIIKKYGSMEVYNKIRFRNRGLIGEINHKNHLKKKQDEIEQWISERHTCKRCGKVMTEKFGSGRFCCRACANSHIQTEEINRKRSESLKKSYNYNYKREERIVNYNDNPNYCSVCGNVLDYNHRKCKTCSTECKNILLGKIAKEHDFGGITKGHGTGRGGKYHGIRCDSRYELVYLLYCLDRGIKITRNKKYFLYEGADGEIHKYYPDFYLSDTDTFVEIKGYFQENTTYKLAAIKKLNINYQLLFWEDIKVLLPFIKEKFGLSYETVDRLYDNN